MVLQLILKVSEHQKDLNEDVIKFISNIKKEPHWMLEWRLRAYSRLKNLKEPNWQKSKNKISKNRLSRFILLFGTKKFGE